MQDLEPEQIYEAIWRAYMIFSAAYCCCHLWHTALLPHSFDTFSTYIIYKEWTTDLHVSSHPKATEFIYEPKWKTTCPIYVHNLPTWPVSYGTSITTQNFTDQQMPWFSNNAFIRFVENSVLSHSLPPPCISNLNSTTHGKGSPVTGPRGPMGWVEV
jgi:hypothetical protein